MTTLIVFALCLVRHRRMHRDHWLVCVAIRREEKNLTLTSEVTSHLTRAGRWLNGVGVRAPHGWAPRTEDPTSGAGANEPTLPQRTILRYVFTDLPVDHNLYA
jgi:hypothetical protein